MPRYLEVLITRLRTNHVFIRSYLHNKRSKIKYPSPLCRLCNVNNETREHLILNCPMIPGNEQLRTQLVDNILHNPNLLKLPKLIGDDPSHIPSRKKQAYHEIILKILINIKKFIHW